MTKRALVVGINDYSGLFGNNNNNLSSCVADANSMQQLLIDSFGFDSSAITLLTDGAAGSAAITSALQNMVANSAAGDVVCFYYSGHGSRVSGDSDRADCDKYYEAIIPASGPTITDRDLYNIANTLAQSVVNFTVILDSCHSGGMDQETDAVSKCRSIQYPSDLPGTLAQYMASLIPCGICIAPDAQVCDGNVSNVTNNNGRISMAEDADKVFVPLAKTTLLAGCRFDELSWETDGHGLLTKAFLDVVNASNFQVNHTSMLDKLRANVADSFATRIRPGLGKDDPKSQTPQLRGQQNRMGEEFLGAWADSR